MYITQLLGVYIIYNKSHALNEVILFGFLHFWALGEKCPNMYFWSVFSRIWTEYGERPIFGHFSCSGRFLENLPLLNIELTLILQFCFLDDLLKLCFLTRCLSIFTAIDEKKEEPKSEKKNLKIHKRSWLVIIWIFKKLNFLKSNYLRNFLHRNQNYLLRKTYKRSHLRTQTIVALSKFVFHYNNYLVLLRIWVVELLPVLFIS